MHISKLTPREREVLTLCADGLTARQKAERLGIALKTVQVHRTNLMRKLQVHRIIVAVRLLLDERRANQRRAA